MAVMKPQGFRGKARPGPARGAERPHTPPRTGSQSSGGAARPARPQRWGNCGGDHASRNCSKPLLAPEGRRCFNCDGVGHAARACTLLDKRAKSTSPQVKRSNGRSSPTSAHAVEDAAHGDDFPSEPRKVFDPASPDRSQVCLVDISRAYFNALIQRTNRLTSSCHHSLGPC